jgi:hypothetical protein
LGYVIKQGGGKMSTVRTRRLLVLLALAATLFVITACAPGPTPAPQIIRETVVVAGTPQIVKETVVVAGAPQVVKETVVVAGTPQIVEKVITTTPPPPPTATPVRSPTPGPPKKLYLGGTMSLTGAYAEDTAAVLAGFQDYAKYGDGSLNCDMPEIFVG